MTDIGSWGRLGRWPHSLSPLSDRGATALPLPPGRLGLAYGRGRSYGDVCLNPEGVLWTTQGLDRFMDWDERTGLLTCEAGVLLRDIQRTLVPRGWMLPVTPGTQIVTVGGAIANDVHGKNHHVHGSFGDHVAELQLLRTDGQRIVCGPQAEPDWFAATVGGLGLTGVILQATLRLRRVEGPWLDTESIPYAGLDEFFALADASENGWEHTVSWIDCLSGRSARGIFLRANMGAGGSGPAAAQRTLRMPLTPPVSLVNKANLRLFNGTYFHLNRLRAGPRRMHYEAFFYPLDHVQEWNRAYGRKGFYQYQCAVPRQGGPDAIEAMLREIAAAGAGSFLSVLKTFGDRTPPGMLSFARSGITLALDFPNAGPPTHALFERLDAIVSQAQGRIYPAKDARMPRTLFESAYPRLGEFLRFRDPGIRSAMSQRLMGN